MSDYLKHFRMALLTMLLFVVGSVQAQTVTGVVKDATGEPIIGATIVEQDVSGNGVITDLDGNFTLQLKGKSKKVKISYVGMKTQVVDASSGKINVSLEDAATSLNDVVVIGYGSVKRKDITGSVATVDNKALTEVPVASAAEALTGKLAGVQVTTSEGSPDAKVKIRVRGGGSITQSNEPLYIVDGFPVDDISNIPATDIQDITVLKDASSTAIYGSRGANGVILVTTKNGQAGKVNVSYNAYYGWKEMAKKMNVLAPGDYVKWQYELALLHDDVKKFADIFGNYQDLDLYQNIQGNDWQDMTYGRTGTTFNHNVSVTGGTEAVRYAFSYAHMNDKAIMIGSNFKRDNFSLKLNTKPTKTTTFDLQARFSDTDILGGGANEASGVYNTDRRLKDAIIYPPIPLAGLASANSSFQDDDLNIYDPITSSADNDRKKDRKNLNIAGGFGWEIFKNFKAKTEFGYDLYRQYDQRFWGLTTYYVKNVPSGTNQNHPAIRFTDSNRHSVRNTNTLSYDFAKLIKNKNHHLDVMVGEEYIITKEREAIDEVHGFPTDYDSGTAWRLSSQGTPYTIDNSYKADDKLWSFFGRANYSYAEKYLATVTFRADASSKFMNDNRWGYFPSVALAWRISSENFMAGTKSWLDDLKLRLSYGTAGNNAIPTGQLVQLYKNSATTWINGFTNYWAPSKTMANPDLKWETTITRNIGLDWTLFGGKLNGSFEFYKNTTKDLLNAFRVPGTGYDTQYRNIGETQNKGFEATFTWHAVNKKDWGIDINGNIGFNKNRVNDLGTMDDFGAYSYWASTEIGNDYWIAAGAPLGQIRGYQLEGNGRYEVTDFTGYDEKTKKWVLKEGVADASGIIGTVRPGSLKLKDQLTVDTDGDGVNDAGDGVITDSDNTIIGNVNPDAYGGFGITAHAYGFDLSAQFSFQIGNKEYNANKIEYTSTSKYYYRNLIDIMADGKRWTNLDPLTGEISNDPARLAELNANTTMWSPYMSKFVLTDWAVEDASFLRLNTITLGYTLPKGFTKRLGINSLRFYATAYNVFCITGYSGFDPEADTVTKDALTPNVDYSGYPRSRSYVIGLNLNF